MPTRRAATALALGLIAALALAQLTVLVGASSARALVPAHAQLVSTTPADGATVRTAAEVVLTFSEDINPKFVDVRVEGPDGDEADGPPAGDGPAVTQSLLDPLPAGKHTVTYRVVSVDGHPVSGTFTFASTQAPATATPSETATTEAPPTTPAASPSATPSVTPSATASPAAEPTATTSAGVPGWLVPVLVGLIAVVLLAGGLLLSRRRPGPGEDPPA
jgi:methionine-rich copper-binding protein CopC